MSEVVVWLVVIAGILGVFYVVLGIEKKCRDFDMDYDWEETEKRLRGGL